MHPSAMSSPGVGPDPRLPAKEESCLPLHGVRLLETYTPKLPGGIKACSGNLPSQSLRPHMKAEGIGDKDLQRSPGSRGQTPSFGTVSTTSGSSWEETPVAARESYEQRFSGRFSNGASGRLQSVEPIDSPRSEDGDAHAKQPRVTNDEVGCHSTGSPYCEGPRVRFVSYLSRNGEGSKPRSREPATHGCLSGALSPTVPGFWLPRSALSPTTETQAQRLDECLRRSLTAERVHANGISYSDNGELR